MNQPKPKSQETIMRSNRILSTNINPKKPLIKALTKIFGLGPTRIKTLLKKLFISSTVTLTDLNKIQYRNLKLELESLVQTIKLELELKRYQTQRIERLISLNTFHGTRHKLGRPVRGQRTHSNAKTQRKLAAKNLK
jgi:small subunit ribosomal protein S13